MTDIERIEEYFTNLQKSHGKCDTFDFAAIDMLDIKPSLHRFEGQETDDSIYVATDKAYRSIGFLNAEVDIYIAMNALGIDKKLIELICYLPRADYEPYQIKFVNNGVTYMASEYVSISLNSEDIVTNLVTMSLDDSLLDVILCRCMKYHQNISTFEKLLNKHGTVNIITKLLDEREYATNNLLYTGEYIMLMLRWINEHSVEGDMIL